MMDTESRTQDAQMNGTTPRRNVLDAVDVVIETFLGSTLMTVGKLSELQAGGLLTLGSSLNSNVELRVNGVTIGLGELVAVGDKFGVRITAISS